MSIVLTRATKQAARYTDAGGRERCSGCRFFMPQGTCGRIIGPVSPRGWCRFFSQEAVQRWQPQGAISAAGGASLDLSFVSGSGVLDPRITFTRASTARYFDSSGTMQTAAINAPRFDYDPVTHAALGLLIEEQRTNISLQSNVGVAPWGAFSAVVAAPIPTVNAAIAPDGTMTATRLVFPAVVTGSSQLSMWYQNITATAAVYTFSLWMRGSVGGEQLYINMSVAGGNYQTSPRLTLTTQWQRFVVVTSTLTAAAWSFEIGTDFRDSAHQVDTPAQTVFVWGAQVELGAFPTSYIPTTAATVTRSIDVLRIPSTTMSWFTSPGGSWMAEFISLTPQGGALRVVGVPVGGGIAPIYTGAPLSQYDGVGLYGTAANVVSGTVAKGATTNNGALARECLNGGAVASNATTGGYSQFLTTGVGFLTTAPAGAAENTTGYIRRVRYWPRILTDAEMQAVTT